MLDLEFIRTNPEIIKANNSRRGSKVSVDDILGLDKKHRDLLTKVETLRAEQNQAGKAIASESDRNNKQALIAEMAELKTRIKALESDLEPIKVELDLLLMQLPNIAHMLVPEGKGEEDNVVVKTWGKKPDFNFEPKDHVELMTNLGMVDFERGTKVHGFRGYFLKGDGARLSWAIWRYAQDFFLDKGFTPFLPPVIVKKDWLYGTGHLPGDGDDIFWTQDDDALAGTAEVPMMAYYADEILIMNNLPFKALAFSPCYRREAGSYGRDTKGLIRVHEFHKLEQLILCEADNEKSADWHEEITQNHEDFIETLGLPYQRLEICTGDLKSAHVRSFDTELWVPLENKYREIGSSSYYHDYQTKRFNTRYRDQDGIIKFAHSLNATAIPTPRLLVSLAENYQQADGSIKIPEVLVPYFGKSIITKV